MSNSGINRNRDNSPLRILLIAGSKASGALIEAELKCAGIAVIVAHPASEAEFIQTATTIAPVAILVDAAFETVPPSLALGVLRSAGSFTPLIVVSESVDEVRAVEWLRAGAENLVVWTNLARLPSAIQSPVVLAPSISTPASPLRARASQARRSSLPGSRRSSRVLRDGAREGRPDHRVRPEVKERNTADSAGSST